MLSNCEHFIFEPLKKNQIKDLYTHRVGEDKIGDSSIEILKNKKFKILGISESIGPQANFGQAGSEFAYSSFLKSFLNTQCHNFPIEQLGIIGNIKLTQKIEKNFSEHVKNLDAFVEKILTLHVKINEIPIVIGGGHNNALPIMKWLNQTYKSNDCHILNIDAHADCRNIHSRHSGNSFSFAIDQKIIGSYSILGLHEAYNNSFIYDFLKNQNIFHTFFEDYIFRNRKIEDDIIQSMKINGHHVGIEIDLDSISNFPSSAQTPCGWGFNEIRFILNEILKYKKSIYYLHLPEAAPKNKNEEIVVGKFISYLVRDFIIYLNKEPLE